MGNYSNQSLDKDYKNYLKKVYQPEKHDVLISSIAQRILEIMNGEKMLLYDSRTGI